MLSGAELKANLTELWGTITQCQLCPTTLQKVFMKGTVRPDVLIVGHNPEEEDFRKGIPFANNTGEVLNGLLSDAGYGEFKLGFTNSIFCSTKQEETIAYESNYNCRQHSSSLISILQPPSVILLGKKTLEVLFPSVKFRLAGSFTSSEFPSTNFYMSYSPSYLLRSPGKRDVVIGGLLDIKDLIKREELLKKDSRTKFNC